MKSFHSKILLFGEYGILKGSMGLAIPYSNYSGTLVQPDEDSILSHKQLESNSVIKKLALKISQIEPFAFKEQIKVFLEDALLGLYFDSTIPNSYGIGSSGALVAAIYDKYFYSDEQGKKESQFYLKNLRIELSKIESFFHGKSSGTDPIVSFLNSPILLNAPSNHFKLQTPSNFKIILIDTGKPSSTNDFMQLFDNKTEKKPDLLKIFIHKNNEAIISFLENRNNLFDVIKDFCDFESYFLSEMFYCPENIAKLYEKHFNNLALKLSGSGGGGFLLGFAKTEAFTALSQDFLSQNIPFKEVELPESKLINV